MEHSFSINKSRRARAKRAAVPLRKELNRGLIALAILCGVGTATFATLSASSVSRSRPKDAVATRLKPAP